MFYFWASIIFFIAAYSFIVWDKIHRTIVALFAGYLAVAIGVLSQKQAISAIDFNTIGLLIGMMILVGITRKSGVFEYIALKIAKLSGGRPIVIMISLSVTTAVLSALLDNVTTVLLIVPVTFAIADHLEVPVLPYLFAEILSSNIGGTATLIGDPPNIMIGSATRLGFIDFLANLALPAIMILIVTVAILVLLYRKSLKTSQEKMQAIKAIDETEAIKDWKLLKRSLVVLGLTFAGFLAHQALHLESATIAIFFATLLILVSGEALEECLLSVEWPIIFFFVGLFILVGGLEANGVIKYLAEKTIALTSDSVLGTGLLVLWLSALASAFVDNIPFVATMIPLLKSVGELTQMPMASIWWALALGACLGGNGSLIGASANVIVAGIAERYGTPIKFWEFFKVGFPFMLLSIAMSTVYLYLAFWR